MNRAFLFEKIMTASEELDREPAPPPPPVTLADFVKEAGVDYLKSCGPGDINATWLERFSGTPLFESAKALAQQSLQRESEEASRESQLQEFKKQIGFQDWGARRAADEQIALQKSMLELELADLRNKEQLAAMQGAPAEGAPVPTLGELGAAPAPAAAPKLASEKLAGPMEALKGAWGAAKGLNWGGLRASAGEIAKSSLAPAAIGAGLGAVGGAVTAGPNESVLGGAAKGALGGAVVGGVGHAAVRSGQALGVGKLMKGGAPAATAAVPAAPAPHVPPTSPGGGGELFPGLAPRSSGGGIPKPPPPVQLGGVATPQMVASAPTQLQVGGVSPNLPVSQIPRNSSQMTELQMDGRIRGRVGGTAPVAATGTKRGLLSGGTGRSLADNISYTGVEGAGQLRTS